MEKFKRLHDKIIRSYKKKAKAEITQDADILFEREKEYHDPMEIESAFNRNFTKYEFNGDRYKTLSFNEYLKIFTSYLIIAIASIKDSGALEAQISVKTLSTSLKDILNPLKYLWGDKKEKIIVIDIDKIINKPFKSLFNGYQEVLKQ